MPSLHSPTEWAARDSGRAFPVLDRLLLAAVVFELASTAFVPALPLAVFGLAFLTPLRQSRSRMLALAILAVTLTLLVVIPLIVTRLGLAQTVDLGPVHRAD